MNFDRNAVHAFRFVRCGFDAASGIARLVYAFDDGPELTETVTIPGAPFVLDEARATAGALCADALQGLPEGATDAAALLRHLAPTTTARSA